MATPACWSWPLPPLPQPNTAAALRRWHQGRCAVCGRHARLQEDHDHAAPGRDVRGWLCRPCNLTEGHSSPTAIARYRNRPPALILGLLLAYDRREHPTVRAARLRWHQALAWARTCHYDAGAGTPPSWLGDNDAPHVPAWMVPYPDPQPGVID